MAFLFGALAEEFGCIGVCDVGHDGVWVRHFHLTVYKIGYGREWQTNFIFFRCPCFNGKVWRVALFVLDILVGMLRILEQISNWLGQTTNLPISQLNWLFLCILFLSAGGRVLWLSTDGRDILLLLLGLKLIILRHRMRLDFLSYAATHLI